MKKYLALILVLLCLLPVSAFAKDLDEIQNYGVSVQLREDGTADLTYHVDWLVLDDKAEGPLEWLKIGIPNKHADSFAAISQHQKDQLSLRRRVLCENYPGPQVLCG